MVLPLQRKAMMMIMIAKVQKLPSVTGKIVIKVKVTSVISKKYLINNNKTTSTALPLQRKLDDDNSLN